MSAPTFAVVGRPNKGKSSIVATLARDDSVYIDSRSGSTRWAREFPMQVNGETLYTLVDTPGIQRAREVMDWLQANCRDASQRPQAVRDFVEAHRSEERFADECQLLQPIVDGAGIIYVVDGSCPYGADYEAEMEILRWSGRPSLALINPIDNDDFADEWRDGLGQYFRTVRLFDAQRAQVTRQLELLDLFGHLDPSWQSSLARAVTLLNREREEQHSQCSLLIADMISAALTFQVSQKLPDGAPLEPVRKLLAANYRERQAKRERNCRRQVEELYHYHDLKRNEQALALEESDLFQLDDWYLWGLNRRSLVAVAGSAGAVLGGGFGLMVDGATGGLLGGLGTLISGTAGAVTGGVGAWKYSDEIAQYRLKGIPTGGKQVSYGPSRNLNFPFVLLGRALLHHRLLCHRTHADRSSLSLDTELLDQANDDQRRKLARCFARISSGKKVEEQRAQLASLILDRCRAHDTPTN